MITKYTIKKTIYSSGKEVGMVLQSTNFPEDVLEEVDSLPSSEQDSIVSFSSDEDMMVMVEAIFNHCYS